GPAGAARGVLLVLTFRTSCDCDPPTSVRPGLVTEVSGVLEPQIITRLSPDILYVAVAVLVTEADLYVAGPELAGRLGRAPMHILFLRHGARFQPWWCRCSNS